MATALYGKAYDGGVVEHYRTYVQAVWRHGREADAATVGHDYRAAIAKAVGRGTGRRGDDETVGLIGNEEIVVDISANGYHGSTVTLQDGNVVESVRTAFYGKRLSSAAWVDIHLDDRVLLYLARLAIHLGKRLLKLRGQHLGKEPQAACVYADDRRAFGQHPVGGLEKRAVAANGYGIVYVKVVAIEHARSLDINIKGYFHCAQQAALKMFKKKSGVIVNISSVSSVLAIPGQSVYSATKGAVNALTATLAKELAPYGIRVNAVAPGFVETEMLDHIPQEQREGYLKSVPMGRFAKPEEVGDAVCTLCDPTLSYLTGQTLILDGGLSL